MAAEGLHSLLPSDLARGLCREGGREVSRNSKEGAGHILGVDAVGLDHVRQQLRRCRQDGVSRVGLHCGCPTDAPALYGARVLIGHVILLHTTKRAWCWWHHARSGFLSSAGYFKRDLPGAEHQPMRLHRQRSS